MALAGFDRSEVEIVTERDVLHVTGRKQKDEQQRTYLHRGIAARDFEQRFQLANHVKVTTASFDNGMLTIELVREVPEALKPRKIVIDGVTRSGDFRRHAAATDRRWRARPQESTISASTMFAIQARVARVPSGSR